MNIPRFAIAVLMVVLALCIVIFAVVMAFFLAAEAFDDALTANVLRWVAGTFLVIGAVDLLILVMALGVQAVSPSSGERISDATGLGERISE